MEKFTMAGDVAVRYSDTGTGSEVIVLLHGYLESLEIWEDFIPLLNKQYRVLTMDIPGHGISEVVGDTHTMGFLADTVYAWLAALQVEKCVLVGHSMGGYIAEAFLAKYPEKLCGLVLLHATPYADSEEKRKNRMREIEIVRAGKKELMARTVPGKSFALENRSRFSQQIEDMGLQVMLTEDEGIIALLNGMALREDRSKVMRESDVPQLYIFGMQDEYILPETVLSVERDQPQARIVRFEHSGHMGFIEQAAECARIIGEFTSECYTR